MIYIIGRGRRDIYGNKNIPINKKLLKIHTIFIDLDKNTNPDYSIDFIDMDYDESEKNIFLFDWSTFYCNCIKNLNKILQKINNFTIYVPLDKSEFKLSDEIIENKYFISKIIEGKYPLYDWKNRSVQKYINPNGFIQIKPNLKY